MRSARLLVAVLALAFPTVARAVFSGPAHAGDDIDRERLRKTLHVPVFQGKFGYGFNADGTTYDIGGPRPDYEIEIARIRESLTGTDSDASRLHSLASALWYAGKQEESKQTLAKARVLFKKRVDGGEKNVELLLEYGDALEESNAMAESETVLRAAAEAFPDRWEPCSAVGRRIAWKSVSAMFQRSVFNANDLNDLLSSPGPGPVSAEAATEGRRGFTEARKWIDRGVEMAPMESSPRVARLQWHMIWSKCLSYLPGVEPGEEGREMDAWLAELRQVSSLRADDIRGIALATLAPLMTGAQKDGEMEESAGRVLFKGRSREKALAAALDLERFAEKPPKASGAIAFEVAGLLRYACAEDAKAIATLRKAIDLDPGREPCWGLLLKLCAWGKDQAAVEEISTRWLRLEDTPHHRLAAASAWDTVGDFAKAEQHVRAALKADPRSIGANLGLAALLLRAPEDAGRRKDADQAAEIAEKGIRDLSDKGETESTDYRQAGLRWWILKAVRKGLDGEAAEAEDCAETALKWEQGNADAHEVLNALKRGAEPPR